MSSLKLISQYFLLITSLFILSSCGGGSKNEGVAANNGGNNKVKGVAGINGIITFEEYSNILERHSGVVSFEVNNGIAKRGVKKASGANPYRHQDGRISFSQGCGGTYTRVLVRTIDGVTTPVTPCGSELSNLPRSTSVYFEFSKISTDGKMIAAEVKHFDANIEWMYTTLVYELTETKKIGKEIARFENFAAPEWLPNNRLMLLPMNSNVNTGIYVTDSAIKNLSRIDNNQISVFINNADVSPSGKDVIFEYNQQIWIMDMKGTKIEELIVGGSALRFPTWSPDGKYIAFLRQAGTLNDYHQEIQFYDVNTKEVVHQINTNDIFDPNSHGSYPSPIGPLSWINKR